MRHGQASMYAENDQARQLTKQGCQEVSLMAQYLNQQQVKLDQVFVSPYVRAQQSAKQLLAQLAVDVPCQTLDLITPSGKASLVHDYLDAVCLENNFNNILLVSHMPFVANLVASLTLDNQTPIFETAAIAEIIYDQEKMAGQLNKIVCPHQLI